MAEIKAASFWVSPRTIEVNTSFYGQYIRPSLGSTSGWIGLFKAGAGVKSYVTYYGDTDERAQTSISWSKGPTSPGDWEMRYYNKSSKLLASCPIRAVSKKIHSFTDEFPSSNNKVTVASKHPQTPLWPAYLPVDVTRLMVMERSKNPSLVVYYANIASARYPAVSYPDAPAAPPTPPLRFGTKGDPILVRWYSWGWTAEPELNALSSLQVRWMGVNFKPADAKGGCKGVLNALTSKETTLAIREDPKTKALVPMLIAKLNGKEAWLRKLFVKTTESLIPSLEYADLYGVDLKTGEQLMQRLKQ